VSAGNKSNVNTKNKISAIKNIDPGKPKKIKQFRSDDKKSFGVKKFTPLISSTDRVLKRRAIESTSKKELVESKAWLISMQKLASKRFDWPHTIHIVSQCISITVE
jgi:hypothetical protein